MCINRSEVIVVFCFIKSHYNPIKRNSLILLLGLGGPRYQVTTAHEPVFHVSREDCVTEVKARDLYYLFVHILLQKRIIFLTTAPSY